MERNVIYLDGGMGTQLQANGLKPGELPEAFMFEHEELLMKLHRNYIESGAQII
ncbi:homocysteine S-methyltransferase family protein [Absiella sp. AM54-8XD]|nr:homocysteine S-methyltransferase family protein [Absiella sp. AM54-8XD]